jgi:antitoxin component YwqK of YwqJK toxin-antitoxin module
MKKLYPLLSVLFLIYWGCEEKVQKSTGGVKPIPSGIKKFMTGYTPPPPPQGEIVDGKMEGLWTFYLINGDIGTHGEMVDGKKEGLWTSYRESGIGGESNYKDGKLHGLTTIYYPPLIGTWFGGRKSREIMYNHDEQIENQRYDRFGFRREEKEWVKKYIEDGSVKE